MAAKARVESLNPLVKVEAVDNMSVLDEENIGASLQSVDLVCVTDWHRDGLVCKLIRSDVLRFTFCRYESTKFAGSAMCRSIAAGPMVLWGTSSAIYSIMSILRREVACCFLLKSAHMQGSDRSSNANGQKSVKVIASYSPLDVALRHKWSSLSKRQTKTLNPSAIFSIIGAYVKQKSYDVVDRER